MASSIVRLFSFREGVKYAVPVWIQQSPSILVRAECEEGQKMERRGSKAGLENGGKVDGKVDGR
jgi:hypothetical protein